MDQVADTAETLCHRRVAVGYGRLDLALDFDGEKDAGDGLPSAAALLFEIVPGGEAVCFRRESEPVAVPGLSAEDDLEGAIGSSCRTGYR